MIKAAFTGSFDPVHLGHFDVVQKAGKLGFRVLAFVANNPAKNYESSLGDRRQRAQEFLKVPVIASASDNIGNEIKAYGCEVIVRGIRNEQDYRYEEAIAEYNLRVNGLETIYIRASTEHRNLSSSAIKAAKNGECRINGLDALRVGYPLIEPLVLDK